MNLSEDVFGGGRRAAREERKSPPLGLAAWARFLPAERTEENDRRQE